MNTSHSESRLAPRRRSLHRITLSLAVIAACGGGETPQQPDGQLDPTASVAVTSTASGVRLVNPGREPLAFAVFEREFSTRSLFTPCIDPGPGCVRLPAGQSIVVPFAQIAGYTAGAREVVAYTWRVVRDSAGAYRAADFRSQVVRL